MKKMAVVTGNESLLALLFSGSNNDLCVLPLSKNALLQHTTRACYQVGYLGKEAISNVDIQDQTLWGWKQNETNKFLPLWQTKYSPIDLEVFISTMYMLFTEV